MISRWGYVYLGLFLLVLSLANEKTRDTFIRDVIEQIREKLNDKTKG